MLFVSVLQVLVPIWVRVWKGRSKSCKQRASGCAGLDAGDIAALLLPPALCSATQRAKT